MSAATDAMLTTRPHPRSAICGTTARTVWNMPVRLTRTSWSHASGVMFAMRAMLFTMPALFTSTSTSPSSARQRRGGGDDGIGIGHVDLHLDGAPPQLADGRRRRHVLVGTGHAPAEAVVLLALEARRVGVGHGDVGSGTARPNAIARPIPRAAPVTSATFPVSA